MSTSGTVAITDADYLRILIHGTTAFEILRTGLEFELFERIEERGGMSVAETATALGVSHQSARILLLGSSSLRLLEKQEEKYVNTELVRHKLLRSGKRFLGPLVDIQSEIINPAMTELAEAMRQNTNVGLRRLSGPGDTLYERLTAHPELQRVFYANMKDVSRHAFAQVLERYDFGSVRHVVDIGGGDGTNGIELARHHPGLEVTIFDQDGVAPFTQQCAAEPELRERVRFQPGDLFTDPLPAGCDAILYFHLFEIWSPERNVELLRRCRDALPDGGVCLVYNFVSDDEGTGPMSAGLLSPYFLTLASGEGMAYSARDMERAVLEAGFSRVERYGDMGFSHALVVGHK